MNTKTFSAGDVVKVTVEAHISPTVSVEIRCAKYFLAQLRVDGVLGLYAFGPDGNRWMDRPLIPKQSFKIGPSYVVTEDDLADYFKIMSGSVQSVRLEKIREPLKTPYKD